MMKKIFLFAALLGLALSGCTKDDNANFSYTNTITFNGDTQEITEAEYFVQIRDGEEVSTIFYFSRAGLDLEIEIPIRHYNKKFSLVEENLNYGVLQPWTLFFEEHNTGRESSISGEPGELLPPRSGKIYNSRVSEGVYELHFEVTYQDGTTLEGNYKGTLTEKIFS